MSDMQEFASQTSTPAPTKKGISDSVVDGFAVVALILIIVTAAVYWLASLPDAY